MATKIEITQNALDEIAMLYMTEMENKAKREIDKLAIGQNNYDEIKPQLSVYGDNIGFEFTASLLRKGGRSYYDIDDVLVFDYEETNKENTEMLPGATISLYARLLSEIKYRNGLIINQL